MTPLFLLCVLMPLQEARSDAAQKFDWGTITPVERSPGAWAISAISPPADRRLPVPEPLPPVVRLASDGDDPVADSSIEYNLEGTRAWLVLPEKFEKDRESKLVLETAERSGQLADGRIVFTAADAEVLGKSARLESHPLNQRIGFWTNLADSVRWKYQPTRPGTYALELTYSLEGGEGSVVELEIATTKQTARLAPTGSWYRYRTIAVGTVSLAGADPIAIVARCLEKSGPAAMNLKALTLCPAAEGKPIVQAEDGLVVCHARDVTIRGVKVQYEPRPEKNTVGYWVNVDDRIQWEFEIKRPGKFDVEILQGCGQGQGGSEVELFVGKQKLRFVVEDTGHFQNFKPRTIGTVTIDKAGRQTLLVQPVKKPGVAVMDLRQVRLIPRSN